MTDRRRRQSTPVAAMVLDDRMMLSIGEVCEVAALERTTVIGFVEEGVLEPRGDRPERWRFPASDLVRLRAAARLQHDLGVNLAGAALALDLLDELRALRRRADMLEALLHEAGAE